MHVKIIKVGVAGFMIVYKGDVQSFADISVTDIVQVDY